MKAAQIERVLRDAAEDLWLVEVTLKDGGTRHGFPTEVRAAGWVEMEDAEARPFSIPLDAIVDVEVIDA